MQDKYSTICGVSENELLSLFKDDIRDLAENNDMTYDEGSGRA